MPPTITLPVPELSVLAIAIGIALLSALIFWATTPWNRNDRSDDRRNDPWTLRALNTFGLILALPWALLISATFVGLWNTLLHSPIANTAIDARWNALAIVGHITALLALVSAPLALIRVYTTERQTRTAEQGHMTDRISKAVEQLGAERTVKIPGKDENGKDITVEATKPNIEVRIGGLLSLERIAQDSVKYDKGRDHVRVMEILTAYVRENAPASGAEISWKQKWEAASEGGEKSNGMTSEEFSKLHGLSALDFGECQTHYALELWSRDLKPPRQDIQISLTVIGRINAIRNTKVSSESSMRTGQHKILDLRNTCLQRADLSNLDFENADFRDAHLEGANLSGCTLRDADFGHAYLIGSYFNKAIMVHANLEFSHAEGAEFGNANLENSNLQHSKMNGARFAKANLLNTYLTHADFSSAAFYCASLANTNFWDVTIDEDTQFTDADFSGASFKSMSFRASKLQHYQCISAFGDMSVIMPLEPNDKLHPWPTHWPNNDLELRTFQVEWRKWQNDPENYKPPPPAPK